MSEARDRLWRPLVTQLVIPLLVLVAMTALYVWLEREGWLPSGVRE
jgi:hypothetical protein